MEHVAREIGRVVTTLHAQRAELEEFLEHITRQLALLEGFTTWQVSAAEKRRTDTAGLGRTMETELEEINREVEANGDLDSLKTKVQSRLAAVASALQDFRANEARREAESEQRTASLRHEVAALTTRTVELTEKCAAQESRLLIDSLTRVGSRYAYEQRLVEEHARWQRHHQPLSFAILDIDRFKRINDEFGHDTGDRLLRAVAELLDRHKRSEDFLARLGGEEFVLLLPMTSLAGAVVVAEKLRAVIETAKFQHKGRIEKITISCGVSEFRPGEIPSAVYDRADRALYRAKEDGRNRCIAD
jgi:diguanylate cyclase